AMIGNIYANNTILSTDRTPYLNRPCLTPTGFSSYVREKLIGCSVAWNNLATDDYSNYNLHGGTLSQSGGKYTVTKSGTGYCLMRKKQSDITIPSGHVVLGVICGIKATTKSGLYISLVQANSNTIDRPVDDNGVIIYKATQNYYGNGIYMPNNSACTSVEFTGLVITDLTLAFGSTVADTLYAMTNNGGIDWLRNHNYPIDQYTQYGYGLYSSKPSAKKVVGFNKWDEEWEVGHRWNGNPNPNTDYWRTKNIIPVTPNTKYYMFVPTSPINISEVDGQIQFYDSNQTYIGGLFPNTFSLNIGEFTTPSNCYYIHFYFYNNIAKSVVVSETCTTYYLGSTELRGHLIVQNGEIVAEGDVRESNGNVQRNYGIVDLGTINWSSGSYGGTAGKYTDAVTTIKLPNYDATPNMVSTKYIPCGCTGALYTAAPDNSITCESGQPRLWVKTTDTPSGYLIYELSTPTTETSSPFADPMSLNGCTTEEYVDDRSIPVPVGHETQYMGQSEDVVEIPSIPQSDGVWVQKCYVSGGKAQYVWELET
ncbi:MAG: hypothetical protein J5725_12065, partial [Bacteroidales bacterium]|nr:hypothetical protein [Bacteroidales bacterium]